MVMNELNLVLPEIILAVAAMGILMVGVFQTGDSLALTSKLSGAALLLIGGLVYFSIGADAQSLFNGLLVVDHLGGYGKILILIAAFLSIFMSLSYFEKEKLAKFEIPVLYLLAVLGMLVMVSANSLLTLYIGVELQSLSLYVVAAIRRNTLKSTESGLKYFVLGALSSCILLYGVSLVYGYTGSLSFEVIATALSQGETPAIGLVLGLVFICTGLGFKISAAPFHMWTPDVYEGAPTAVTSFFAVAPKVAALILFTRVLMGPFQVVIEQWQQIIWCMAFLSLFAGSLGAIAQKNIKRLMAYSSIGHVGFALVGLTAGSKDGVAAVLIYLGLYLIMNIGAFATILSMRRSGVAVEDIQDLAGLSKTNPMVAFSFLLIMFSMAGVPPLAGFLGKFFVIKAALDAGFVYLSVAAVIASVVSAFYYIRLIKIMFFDDAQEKLDKEDSFILPILMKVSAVLLIILFIFPSPIVDTARQAAAAFVG